MDGFLIKHLPSDYVRQNSEVLNNLFLTAVFVLSEHASQEVLSVFDKWTFRE